MGKHIIVWVGVVLMGTMLVAQAPDLKNMDVVERSVPVGPVAVIDKVPIEGSDFLDEYRRNLKSFAQMANAPELTDEFRVRAGLTILGDMLRHEILLKEVQRRNITVPESDIEKLYQEKLLYFEKMLSKGSSEKPTEERVLEQAGQTRDQAITSIRNQLLMERVAESIAKEKGAVVTDVEVRKYYEENSQLFEKQGRMHLAQVLIIPKPNASNADESAWKTAEKTAERARARILAGEQFAAVARDMSEAPDASQGGELGMLPVNELPPFFVDVAVGMESGDLSGIFRSEYGVHLLKLIEVETAGTVPFEKAQPVIHRMLYRVRLDDAVLDFCEPIVNDPKRTKVFIQLDRTLAAQGGFSTP
ncbi:MAG: peptidylprolyl isomerase [Candidatus Hydrogenedentes bacterium]|nr:peptidylprolyl isomerase [Candidatus Hydrogenedentota bacterium]